MKITMTATDLLTTMDGVPGRIWEGVTENGIACKVFVHRVIVSKDVDATQFERELTEQLPPGRHIPLSHIL